MLWRHLLFGKRIAGRFVFADLVDVRINAEFVERATEEHDVRSKSRDEQFTRRRHENLVASRGHVIVLVHSHFHVGIDGLARRAKIFDRATNFFRLGPTDVRRVNVQQDRSDALVGCRLAKLSYQARQRLWLPAKNAPDRIVRDVIGQRAGNSQGRDCRQIEL